MEKERPKKTFRAGSVRASIWDNEISLPNGETRNMPRVRVERRYKNDQNEWVSTNYFNVNELAKLQAVIRAAFDYLVVTERERTEEQVLTTEQSELAGEERRDGT